MDKIFVETTVRASITKIWEYWAEPRHITKWCYGSDDWETPYADNDLRVAGTFKTTMAAKDGSASFDFKGEYTLVEKFKHIEYVMDDGREVSVHFEETDDGVRIVETFDPETENSLEIQKNGWQSVLENFKNYVEKQDV